MTDPVTASAPGADPVTPQAPDAPAVETTPSAASTPPPATIVEAAPVEGAEGWGNDWRQKYAGEDEKVLKRLERYASPKAALDALFEAQTKISKGEFARPLAADATPEQVSEWRKANGIPEKPDGYFEKLPNDVVLGDEDRAILNGFAERMHAKNVTPDVMAEVVSWYDEFRNNEMERRAEIERTSLEAVQEAMREEWGGDYKANLNIVKSFLASAPAAVNEGLLSARGPDGTPTLNNPDVMRWLVNMARELNPAATVVPGSGNATASVADEIANIEKTMRENRRAYMADEKMQARYRQLLDARERLARAS